MDVITASVISILGKYALDKGAELAKEAGPAAKEAAEKLFDKIIGYFRDKPETQAIANGYENNPTGYEVPMQDQVDTAVQQDADLKAELEKLIAQYKKEKEAFQAAQPGSTQVSVSEGGTAVVGSGNTVVGERGVYVKGSVKGGITTGDTGMPKPDEA